MQLAEIIKREKYVVLLNGQNKKLKELISDQEKIIQKLEQLLQQQKLQIQIQNQIIQDQKQQLEIIPCKFYAKKFYKKNDYH